MTYLLTQKLEVRYLLHLVSWSRVCLLNCIAVFETVNSKHKKERMLMVSLLYIYTYTYIGHIARQNAASAWPLVIAPRYMIMKRGGLGSHILTRSVFCAPSPDC